MSKTKREIPPAMDVKVTIRMSKDMHDIVETEAKQAKLSISEYFRNLVLKHKVDIYEERVFYSKDLLKKLADLGRIGNNLNQIARHLNEGVEFDEKMKKDIYVCISSLYDLRDAILEEAGEYRYGDS